MNTPAELARELVRRGCRVEVRRGVHWVVPPDAMTKLWADRHKDYLRANRDEVLAEMMAGGCACEPERCDLCNCLVFIPELAGRLCNMAGVRRYERVTGRCPYKRQGG